MRGDRWLAKGTLPLNEPSRGVCPAFTRALNHPRVKANHFSHALTPTSDRRRAPTNIFQPSKTSLQSSAQILQCFAPSLQSFARAPPLPPRAAPRLFTQSRRARFCRGPWMANAPRASLHPTFAGGTEPTRAPRHTTLRARIRRCRIGTGHRREFCRPRTDARMFHARAATPNAHCTTLSDAKSARPDRLPRANSVLTMRRACRKGRPGGCPRSFSSTVQTIG